VQIAIFNAKGLTILNNADINTVQPELDDTIWIDVHRPTPETMRVLQDKYHFHPLAVEDTLNQHQRPKVEEYDGYLFIITNHVVFKDRHLTFLELDIFLGKNYIVTVHNACEAVTSEVVSRIGRSTTFRHFSSEYLLYVVMDTVVDAYFPVVNELDTELEELSEAVIRRPLPRLLERLTHLRRMLGEMWHVIEQQHGMFSVLSRHEIDLLTHHEVLEYYLRDVNDHLHRILNHVGVLRENVTSIVEMYLSAASYHLNRVVNRLTVITITIGIFTVIAGIYGMNFLKTWPPFDADWGAPAAVLMMVVLSGLALGLFRRMKWF
jgi:magnesium transporter